MVSQKIEIKLAEPGIFLEIELCAKEFIDFIDDFKQNFLNGNFFVLTAYYNSIMAGVLVAENKIEQIYSLEKIVPSICLHLIYVNKKFRNKQIGKNLLDFFINLQKQYGIASIYIEIPQRYRKGIFYLQKNNFHQVDKIQNNIILELNLWNDFGIIDSHIIEEDLNNMLS